MKRYIYIIIGIIVVAIIAIALIFFFKNQSSSSPTTSGDTGSLPQVGTQSTGGTQGNGNGPLGTSQQSSTPTTGTSTTIQSFGVLSSSPVLDYFVNAQNNITAIGTDGTIFQISNGQSSSLSTSQISTIIAASFSYDGKKILVNFGDPSNPQSSIFDVATKAWMPLPQGLISPQWALSGYQVAYLSTIGSGGSALSTIDASNIKKAQVRLLTLNANDLSLQWLSKSRIILSSRPAYSAAGSILLFDLQKGTLTPIVLERNGVESIWSHSTSTSHGLVFFNYHNPILQLVDSSGNVIHNLSFLTLPSKCLFNTELVPIASSTSTPTSTMATSSSKKVTSKPVATSTPNLMLYCAVPQNQGFFSAAQLPDDYEKMSLFTSDNIIKTNTFTGDTETIWDDQGQNLDVTDLKFFNGTLFFTNRYDRKLYGISFTQ